MWVYILESESTKKLYIGVSRNAEERLKNHNLGKQTWTRKYLPWKLIAKVKTGSKTEALKLERKLKNFRNPSYIRKLINDNRLAQLVVPTSSG